MLLCCLYICLLARPRFRYQTRLAWQAVSSIQDNGLQGDWWFSKLNFPRKWDLALGTDQLEGIKSLTSFMASSVSVSWRAIPQHIPDHSRSDDSDLTSIQVRSISFYHPRYKSKTFTAFCRISRGLRAAANLTSVFRRQIGKALT